MALISTEDLEKAKKEGDQGDGGKAAAGLSEEDVGRVVNAAVTSHLKRALGPAITEAFGGLKLDDKIAELIAKAVPKPKDGEGEGAGTGGKGKQTDLEKQFADLSAKLEATEKRATDAERSRIETEQKSKFDNAFTSFRNLVQPKLKPEFLDVVVPHWARTEGRLKVGDDGAATLRVKRAPYKGAPEQDEYLPLEEAVPILLASAEAKAFLPAPGSDGRDGTKGNSGRPVRQSGGGSSDKSDPMQKSIADLEKMGVSLDDLLT